MKLVNQTLARGFDHVYKPAWLHSMEKLTFQAAALGFFLHLSLIFLQRQFAFDWPVLKQLSSSYLSAMYTPFSFILFFEVLMMVSTIPRSMTQSLARQYQLVTLIVLRRVFKDIAQFEKTEVWSFGNPWLQKILIDMGASLLMFLLIVVFFGLRKKLKTLSKEETLSPQQQEKLDDFVRLKKSFAFILTLVLFGLSVVSVCTWTLSVFSGGNALNVNHVFYQDFFTVMVLFDVLILIYSFAYTQDYAQIYRNAGFVISTILIRIAFSAPLLFNILFLLSALLFGTATLGLYTLYKTAEKRAWIEPV